MTPLASRPALIKDGKVFNTQLKGLDAKGEYPGPRTNQLSSGRCWLFATSESYPRRHADDKPMSFATRS